MVTEARETGSLIGSDKVEGTAVYGGGQPENWIDRARHDRQNVRQGFICGSKFRRFFWESGTTIIPFLGSR